VSPYDPRRRVPSGHRSRARRKNVSSSPSLVAVMVPVRSSPPASSLTTMMSPTPASGTAEQGTNMLSASARTGARYIHCQVCGDSFIADRYRYPSHRILQVRLSSLVEQCRCVDHRLLRVLADAWKLEVGLFRPPPELEFHHARSVFKRAHRVNDEHTTIDRYGTSGAGWATGLAGVTCVALTASHVVIGTGWRSSSVCNACRVGTNRCHWPHVIGRTCLLPEPQCQA
jgi:hypothetical protein